MDSTNLPGLTAALINDDISPDKPVRLLCEAGFYTAALSLMNSMLGAGILAYPYAYMSSGTLVGTILALTIGCLSFMAINVIFKLMAIATASDESIRGYGDLVGAAFGRRYRIAVDGLLVVYAYGACVGCAPLPSPSSPPLVSPWAQS